MTTTKDLSESCLRILRAHLEPKEVEIARGRCDYADTVQQVPMQSGYTFLLVTDVRMLWTDFLDPGRVSALRFSEVRSYSQGPVKHRWVVLLRHGPVDRGVVDPPRSNRPTRGKRPATWIAAERTQTVIEFSRRNTSAAAAILGKLSELRAAEMEPLHFPVRPRVRPTPLTVVPEPSWIRWIRRMRWRFLRRFD